MDEHSSCRAACYPCRSGVSPNLAPTLTPSPSSSPTLIPSPSPSRSRSRSPSPIPIPIPTPIPEQACSMSIRSIEAAAPMHSHRVRSSETSSVMTWRDVGEIWARCGRDVGEIQGGRLRDEKGDDLGRGRANYGTWVLTTEQGEQLRDEGGNYGTAA